MHSQGKEIILFLQNAIRGVPNYRVMVKCFVQTSQCNYHICFVPRRSGQALHDKQWVLCSTLLLTFNFNTGACHSDAGGIHLRFNHCRFFDIIFAFMAVKHNPTTFSHGWWVTRPATIWNAPSNKYFSSCSSG
jgi:hypothetical protein